MDTDFVLSSRVRLARNYDDLPFRGVMDEENAEVCLSRTVAAMNRAGAEEGFMLIRLRDLSDNQRRVLAEQHFVSEDLLQQPDMAAVLLNAAEGVSVMINEEDHLRIQAIRPGMDILGAAQRAFRVDDALSRQVRFAFDDELGYLTACPTNTGTGMRASLLMHLPMLTAKKQMGNVSQIVAKVGLTVRGVYGEGSEALGQIYLISNQVTLGRSEQDLISALSAVGQQLMGMEQTLRQQALEKERVKLEDSVYRGFAVLNHARLLAAPELYRCWSGLRLGCAMGILKATTRLCDELLDEAQDAHLRAWAEQALEGESLNEARASRVRELMRVIRHAM